MTIADIIGRNRQEAGRAATIAAARLAQAGAVPVVARPAAGPGAHAPLSHPEIPQPSVDTAPPACTSPTFPGIHIQPAMATPREQELDRQIREQLKNDPAALAEYERLLETDLFNQADIRFWQPLCGPGQNGEARIAILEQVLNYPDPEAIESLGRLGGRGWYRLMSFDDQQRSAKMIGVNESSSTPNDNHVRDNTVEYLLTRDDLVLRWEETPGAYGSASGGWPDVITLNPSMVEAGPGAVRLDDDDERHVTLNTSAHEVNHIVNPGATGGYSQLMNEYRAWYVGYTAEHGHPPSRQEGLDRASIYLDEGSPSFIEDYRDNPAEQAKIIAFVAELAGLPNPSSVTKAQLDALLASPTPVPDGNVPASVPRPTSSSDPNNLDNAY